MQHRPPRSVFRHSRVGFTLVELLVVIGIIGLLVSMLMPAMQRTREAARRTSCLNNIRQLAIATQSYLARHRKYPSGWIADPEVPICAISVEPTPFPEPIFVTTQGQQRQVINNWAMGPYWSWQALILPDIDAGTIKINYTQQKTNWDQNGNAANPDPINSNWEYIRVPIPLYVCPSASLPEQRPGNLAYGTYRGNMGAWQTNDPNAPLNNGVFYGNSSLDDRNISDGASTTIGFGESLFGFWADSYSAIARARDDYPGFDNYWTGPGNCNDLTVHYFGFGSDHGDQINFAFMDGSARPVAKNIETRIFWAACTRNGDETIGKEF